MFYKDIKAVTELVNDTVNYFKDVQSRLLEDDNKSKIAIDYICYQLEKLTKQFLSGKVVLEQSDIKEINEFLNGIWDDKEALEKFPEFQKMLENNSDSDSDSDAGNEDPNPWISSHITEIKKMLTAAEKSLAFEKTVSLTTMIHAEILKYYNDNLSFMTPEKRKDIEMIMKLLVLPYQNNDALVAAMKKAIPDVSSNHLKDVISTTLERHEIRPFLDHYQSKNTLSDSSKPVPSNVPTKPYDRFTRDFAGKPSGAAPGSIGFKTIIPSEKGSISPYLNSWVIKRRNPEPGIVSNPRQEVEKAQLVRKNLKDSTGKERYVVSDSTEEVASKMFPKFMTVEDFFDKRERLDSSNDPLDLDHGLICGKPVVGLIKINELFKTIRPEDFHANGLAPEKQTLISIN
jgi:hypothetical protein